MTRMTPPNQGQIACCSSVSLGFGTPQLQYLLSSLQKYYSPAQPIQVCEPHSNVIPARHEEFPAFSFCRVQSQDWKAPYWYMDRGPGEEEYRHEVARWIARCRPEMLILTSMNQFEYLVQSRHRPKFLIYYAFEIYPPGELTPRMATCHEKGKRWLSLALFPEANRIRYFNEEFGYRGIPKALVYNVPPKRSGRPVAAGKRNGRILMQGTLEWGLTYVEYLLNTQKPDIPIDVFGPIYGNESRILNYPEITRLFGIRYMGYVPNSELCRIRQDYAYLLVMWNPTSLNTLYACPNKFFEAIASGVPPICAPHPQCKKFISRYDCGILMKDWSFASFCSALDEARRVYGTKRYRQLVSNCIHAHRSELHWESQFKKIAVSLPTLSGAGATLRKRRSHHARKATKHGSEF